MTRAKADAPVIEVLIQVVAKNGRWGFRLCFDWMRNHCYEWNHKRIWRIYKEMALTLFRETKVIKPALEMLNIIKWPRSSKNCSKSNLLSKLNEIDVAILSDSLSIYRPELKSDPRKNRRNSITVLPVVNGMLWPKSNGVKSGCIGYLRHLKPAEPFLAQAPHSRH